MPRSTKKHDTGQYATYAERRANAALQMLAETSTGISMWVDVGTKDDVALSKTASDWKVFTANRATTTIDTTLHSVVQTLFQATKTSKYQEFMRAMWGDAHLDARVIEVVGADAESSTSTMALQRNKASVFHKTHKRTSIKWFATAGKSKLSKAQEYHLVEFIGLVYDHRRVQSIYVYQESLAKTDEIPLPHQAHAPVNYERMRLEGLLLKFEELELPSGGAYVLLSMALQRPPSLLDFGFRNPAEDLVLRFAKGFRDALRRSSTALAAAATPLLKVAHTASWVPDTDRPACSLCSRAFHTLVRRRHHCRVCGEVVCFQCSNVFAATSLLAADRPSTHVQGDVRLCNRCVVQQQADAGRGGGMAMTAHELQHWLDTELSENNPDLFDQHQPTVVRAALPSGGAFTGTLEVNSLGSPAVLEKTAKHPEETSVGPEMMSPRTTMSHGTFFAEDFPPPPPRPPAPTTTGGGGISLGSERRNFDTSEPPSSENRSSSTSSHGSAPSSRSGGGGLDHFNLALAPPPPSTPAPRLSGSSSQRQPHRRYPSFESTSSPFDDATSMRSLVIDPKYLPRTTTTTRPTPTRRPVVAVRAASAWASVTTSTGAAVATAMRDLEGSIGGPAHFLVVSFSEACDAIEIMAALEHLAPGIPYVGGLSARGVCDQDAWVAMKRGGLVALWGIHDPVGVYAVGTISYDESNAKDEAYETLCVAQRSLGSHLPAFCLAYACPLVVDDALAGVRLAIDCPILGGCSVLSTHYQGYLQISSAGGTSIGMAFALCAPSVETSVGWFSGYDAVNTALGDPTACMGVVTAADPTAKLIYEIDHRPAAAVYQEWLARVHEIADTSPLPTKFPRLGYMYPLGQVVPGSSPLVVNTTPVVTALDDDTGALSTTIAIQKGATIALMHTSLDTLKDAVKLMGKSVQQDQKFALADVEGCLMFLSAGVQVVLGSSLSMSGLVGSYRLWSGGASLLGLTSFGEIGHLPHEVHPQCDALMFSCLVFSNRRRKTTLFVETTHI
ncbi:Aste57867_8148 [Aphanomyces stellatus]|uniref:Aste57867_8148 protein n=1 Tax=Aphanomyces stellatus TaxID=120398 RepID=A0A485KJG5_9STRA|nr:hypothetical protein As57867_008118 [Aphanomyces stellatus]VFT85037.1 Aste57867_8148 [Aphanomyces stellatus]